MEPPWYHWHGWRSCIFGLPQTLQLTLMANARCKLIELVEEGMLTWEIVAREFTVFNSEDDCQDVLDTLTDNDN